jgi:hypothetical protein
MLAENVPQDTTPPQFQTRKEKLWLSANHAQSQMPLNVLTPQQSQNVPLDSSRLMPPVLLAQQDVLNALMPPLALNAQLDSSTTTELAKLVLLH